MTERQKKIILDLIQIAWASGAVRSEQLAAELQEMRGAEWLQPSVSTTAKG